MKKTFVFATMLVLAACGGAGVRGGKATDTTHTAAAAPAAAADGGANQLMDTAALKQDMDNVIGAMAGGKPDTNALKKAAKDFLSTSQRVLSDSGIDAMYGNSSDPAVRAAAETLKKYRNASGLTPDKLDSLKKAADLLKVN